MSNGILVALVSTGRAAAGDQFVGCMRSISAHWLGRAGLFQATLRALVVFLAAVASPAISVAIGLNDTGVDQCGDLNAMGSSLCTAYSSDASLYPRQDANLGRDALARAASLSKIGAGSKGFDFTKIANNGTDLPASAVQGTGATDWACTRDNVTGLVWEVKTASGLHSATSTFSWYKAGVGTSNGGSCQTAGNCDTEKFVANVNNAGFCGFNDWRMPTVKELEGLSDFGKPITASSVAIDTSYFPNTAGADNVWTATSDPTNTPAQFAYAVIFADGGMAKFQLATNNKVRLVRGAPVSRQFVLSGNVVLDTSYGLMWKRDYEMLSPGNPSPNLNVDTFTWSDALRRSVSDTTGGFNDWRLPNVKELRSLVDETRFNPALDTTIFNALLPASVFWSSSPAQSFDFYTNMSWVVQFDNGVNLGTMGRSAKNYVRLVRNLAVGEQAIGTVNFSPATVAVGGTTTASATGGPSGNPVTFSSTTPTICTVSGTNGSTIAGLHAGTCVIAANQAGSTLYAPAPQITQNLTVGKASQTIGVVTFSPNTLAIGGATTASATAISGLAVSFSSNTSGVCTTGGTNGRTITGVTSGTCTLTASQAGDADYLAATSVTGSITVKVGQTISVIGFSPSTVKAGETTTASATGGSSGNPVTFSTSSPGSICTVNSTSGLVTAVGVGICDVYANQVGNSTYADALPVHNTITVAKGTQSIGAIGFSPLSLTVGSTTTVSAVATSGLAVSFGVNTTSPSCTILGAVVTGKQVGTCTVGAYQGGNVNFEYAEPVAVHLVVGQGAQSISSISFTPNFLSGGGTSTVSAAATSLLPVTFTSLTPSSCTATGTNGSTITGGSPGTTCTIQANQAGDSNYLAAPPITADVFVKIGQTIGTIGFAPPTLTVGTTTQASATGGASGIAVTFSTNSLPSICTVTVAGLVTGKGVGSCVVTADQAGSGNYTPAIQTTRTIVVEQGSQTIDAITLVGSLSVGSTSTARATATSGLAVTFTAGPPGTCTATGTNGSTITGVAAGFCTISANQGGDANFVPAPQVQITPNVLLKQSISSTLTFTPSSVVVGGTTTVSATGGGSGNPVVFDSGTPSSCSVSGAIVTGLSIAPCLIFANQAGNSTYAAANPEVEYLVIGQGAQTIGSLSFSPNTLRVGGFTTASATATSGYPVTFTSKTPTVCTVGGTHGQTVTGMAIGTCTIEANQDGVQDVLQNYNAASPVTGTISSASTIEFSPASLTFDPLGVGSTSAVKSVTMTNHSATVLTINSLASTINGVFKVVNNTCGSTVAAGANCTFDVTFTPDAVVTRVGAIRVDSNASTTPDNLTPVTGQGIVPPTPTCSLTATPSRVSSGRSSTLTAACSGAPTTYAWTGVNCAGTTAATCTVTPGVTTTYGVTATNGSGTSSPVTAKVTVGSVDLTPILMLLLD